LIKVAQLNDPDYGLSVIDTATNTVIATVTGLGAGPVAFGNFIQPKPKFAGTPGTPNCNGKSVSALSQQFGNDLGAAATALGFANVSALQNAIKGFCGAVS
jgi:YVTN family beta-propeller protein